MKMEGKEWIPTVLFSLHVIFKIFFTTSHVLTSVVLVVKMNIGETGCLICIVFISLEIF